MTPGIDTTTTLTTPTTRSWSLLSTLTWTVLVLAVVANVVASALDAPLVLHLGLGALAAAGVAAVTVLHLRARR